MKKSFLLLAGVAAALASCSKTETTDRPQGSAIGFAGAWIGHAVESKAQNDANITTEGIDHFFVFGGYEGFNNVFGTAEAGEQAIGTKVTKKAADSWTYSPVRYWVEDKTYDFAAYSPDLTDVATVAADVANKAISFTNFISDKDRQHDLIYASVSNATHEQKVQFSFSHALSMIRFTFKSAFGENTTLHIKDFKFYGMSLQGNYSFQTDEMDWGGHTNSAIESTAFTNSDLEISGTEEEATDDYLVIPQSVPARAMTVSFTAEIWTKGAEAATKSRPISVQLQTLENGWTAGQCYNYTVTIDGENLEMKPIEFGDPTVTEWPNKPTDIPVEIPM
ncbi:MAG: fimbrillin family protein [Alistipes sp.]